MNSKRLHLVLTASLAIMFVGLLAGTYGVNQLLTSRSGKLTALKAQNLAYTQQKTSLTKAKKDIESYSELHKITQTVVPEDKNQAEAVREIVNIAAANGISLSTITFPASTLGNAATPTTQGSAAGSGAGAAAAAKAAGNLNAKTNLLSQLTPVTNIPGVYSLIITVQSDADHPVQYAKFVSFLNALEHNRRTAQVSIISLDPSTENPGLLSFNLTLNEYIKP